MRLVFSRHYAQRIVEADGVVRPDEVQFMEHVFPEELMRRMGLGGDRIQRGSAAGGDCLPGHDVPLEWRSRLDGAGAVLAAGVGVGRWL